MQTVCIETDLTMKAYKGFTVTNKEAFDKWASTRVLKTIHFGWGLKGENELTLRNRTYNDAVLVANQFGWQEPCWFNPWTWTHWVVTVG